MTELKRFTVKVLQKKKITPLKINQGQNRNRKIEDDSNYKLNYLRTHERHKVCDAIHDTYSHLNHSIPDFMSILFVHYVSFLTPSLTLTRLGPPVSLEVLHRL